MTVFFTSDLHLGHRNVIPYCSRPFADIEEMGRCLIKNWNDTVGENDTVYMLGDLSLNVREVEAVMPLLNGNKKLVPGNHDWCHPAHSKSKTKVKADNVANRYAAAGVEILSLEHRLFFTDYGASFCLSHFPYQGDDTDGRYLNYRVPDRGVLLLCGHVHQAWSHKKSPGGSLMINVGVDVRDYKPISLAEIIDIVIENA